MPLQPREIPGDAWPQIDARHVAPTAGPHALHLLPLGENAFGEQETDGQLEVVAGRSHGDRDGAMNSSPVDVAPQANLQRLLDRQHVRLDGLAGARDPTHPYCGQGGFDLV